MTDRFGADCSAFQVTTGTTSVTALDARSGTNKRVQFVITNTSATSIVTLRKGEVAAVANVGIVLLPSGSYLESSDAGTECWQGQVQVISDAAGTVAVVEMLTPAVRK